MLYHQDRRTSGFTTKYQHHTPSGFGYKVVGTTQSKSTVIYRGTDVIEIFLERLVEEEQEITQTLDDIKPMIITPQQTRIYTFINEYSI